MAENNKEVKDKVSTKGNAGTLKKNKSNVVLSAGRQTSSRRHKKRRNKPPPGYDEWDDESKEYYNDVTAALRNWKASRVQCQLRRFTMGFWQHLKYQLKGHPMHAAEMKDYKNAMEAFAALKEERSLDYD